LNSVTIPIVITSGLLDGLNPCAFGVLLSFVAVILASVALTTDPRPRLWRAGGVYVAGMFLTYLLLGLGIVATVSLFTSTHLPIRLMGFVVVMMGLWAASGPPQRRVEDLRGLEPPVQLGRTFLGCCPWYSVTVK
jgi:cytochrome c biogenesis protein CcdA